MNAYTVVLQPQQGRPKTLRISAARVRIGRGQGEISLEDPMISTSHAELTFQDGILVFTDVGSSNGSFDRAGHRIQGSVELQTGDVVQLGQTVITVKAIEGAPAEPEYDEEDSPPEERTIVDPNFRWRPDEPLGQAQKTGAAHGAGNGAEGADYADADHADAGSPAGAGAAAGKKGKLAKSPKAAKQAPKQPRAASRPAPRGPAGPAMGALPEPAGDTPVDLLKAGWAQFMSVIGKGEAPNQPPEEAEPWMDVLKGGWEDLQPHIKQAPIVLGVLTVPVGVLWGVVSFVPSLASVASLVAMVANLAMVFGYVGLAHYVIRHRIGEELDWQQAWKYAIARPVPTFVSMFLAGILAFVGAIALIIPGLALGLFIVPALVAEGRENFGLNARSLTLFVQEPIRILLVGLCGGLAIGVAGIAVGIVFGFVPAVGALLGGLAGAVIQAAGGAWLMFVMVRLYFDLRRRYEGGDPEAETAAYLAESDAA